jgi:REP-associated tyrosine transposase
MPRRARCVLPGIAYHVTQRGVDRRATFSADEDRHTYLRLLGENLREADVRLWAWCLMTNHVHLVLLPGSEESLSVLFRRVHGRYAQYYNARWGRSGHLWQNRFFSCILGTGHLWTALAYVERNPVRAGMVEAAVDYPWSSAAAHTTGIAPTGLLDMAWWQNEDQRIGARR